MPMASAALAPGSPRPERAERVPRASASTRLQLRDTRTPAARRVGPCPRVRRRSGPLPPAAFGAGEGGPLRREARSGRPRPPRGARALAALAARRGREGPSPRPARLESCRGGAPPARTSRPGRGGWRRPRRRPPGRRAGSPGPARPPRFASRSGGCGYGFLSSGGLGLGFAVAAGGATCSGRSAPDVLISASGSAGGVEG
jgi:hypothetical protein